MPKIKIEDVLDKWDFEAASFKFSDDSRKEIEAEYWRERGYNPPPPLSPPDPRDGYAGWKFNPRVDWEAFIRHLEGSVNDTLIDWQKLKGNLSRSKKRDILDKLKTSATNLLNKLDQLHPSIKAELNSSALNSKRVRPNRPIVAS
jgi:hypothetical protein